MKIILLIMSLFLISGRLYSFEGECVRPIIQVVSSNCYKKRELFSSIAYYQKIDSIGHTDINQRWRDAELCGAKYGDSSLWSVIEPHNFRNKFRICMESKGYHIFDSSECGVKEPKSLNKGICNE